jgi:hypothetical protein
MGEGGEQTRKPRPPAQAPVKMDWWWAQTVPFHGLRFDLFQGEE